LLLWKKYFYCQNDLEWRKKKIRMMTVRGMEKVTGVDKGEMYEG
jgi:hypothetical protein